MNLQLQTIQILYCLYAKKLPLNFAYNLALNQLIPINIVDANL